MQYWVSIHRPDGYDASVETEQMAKEIDAVNDEMVAAGVRVFVGGLQPTERAFSIVLEPNGETSVSPGKYMKSNEFVGGFWVLEVATPEEAVEWGKKAAKACQANVEVRPFH